MKIYYLDKDVPLLPQDLHLRRWHLYGPDIVLLTDRDGEHSINVGPLWSASPGGWGQPAPHPDLAVRVASAMKQRGDGILMVGNHLLATALIKAGAKFAFDPTDSASLFYRRRISGALIGSPQKIVNSMRLFTQYRRHEQYILEHTPCFVISGRADEAWLRRLSPAANILRVENGTRLIRQPAVAPAHDGCTIGFHGYMAWEPNHAAADILTGSIARDLAKSPGPTVRIRIAGSDTPRRIQRRDGKNGVEICGFVSDLREWLSSLTLYVMPMVLGAGVKNKLIEALAAGVPVLTNERGAESLPEDCLSAVAIVKDEKDWSSSIRDLLSRPDELSRMRSEGRRSALAQFDWEEHRRKLHDELARLKGENRL